jgi:hypothetical protein
VAWTPEGMQMAGSLFLSWVVKGNAKSKLRARPCMCASVLQDNPVVDDMKVSPVVFHLPLQCLHTCIHAQNEAWQALEQCSLSCSGHHLTEPLPGRSQHLLLLPLLLPLDPCR